MRPQETAPSPGACTTSAPQKIVPAPAQHNEAPLGLANPLLYRLGEMHSPALRDITIANNDVYGLGCCDAGPGYNEAAGWGSPNVTALISAAGLAGK
jgi:hypothetical protein